MKIRTGFVSNSSSSSFVVVYKVNVNDELKKYMAEEFGKYGTKLLEDYVTDKEETLEDWEHDCLIPEDWEKIVAGTVAPDEDDEDYDYSKDYPLLNAVSKLKLTDNDNYLTIRRIYNSNDPDDMSDDGCWLADHIPAEFIDKLYEEEPY